MKKVNKLFFAATFTLVGAIFGAGILGLPYVFAQSGFGVGMFWLIFLGFILLYVNLCLGEITLRTKEFHQLPGYAKKYLGQKGKIFVLIAFCFSAYSAMLAYLIGEGQSLSYFFTGTLDYAIYFGIGFWVLMTLLLREGLRGLKKIETWGVFAIIFIIFAIFVYYFPQININNFGITTNNNFFFPFGVTLFALLGFTAIPEMRRILNKHEYLLKKSIIFGGKIIPFVLYFIFVVTCLGVLGKNIPEVATLAFGRLITILGIFTMMTCYFVFSFALKDVFVFDLNKRKISWFFVSVVPLLIYLFVSFFGFASFILILSIGGAVSGGLKGIIILLMNKKSKEKGNRNPEYSIPINWVVIGLLSLVFFSGIIFTLFL